MFCDHCVKDVHLLSKMTEHEARAFMREHEGEDICVSYAIRPDGGIRFRAEPKLVPVAALARRMARPGPPRMGPQRMGMAASIGAAALLAACTAHSQPEPEPAPSKQDAPIEVRVEPAPPVVEPCDPGELVDMQVEGGIRAMPLDDPPQPTVAPQPDRKPVPHRRGGVRAKPIHDSKSALLDI